MGMMSSGSNNKPMTMGVMRIQCWSLALLLILATTAFVSV